MQRTTAGLLSILLLFPVLVPAKARQEEKPAAPLPPAGGPQEPPGKAAPPPAPLKPMTEDEAAAAVLSAWKAKDDPLLKVLAAKDDPDPWIVADNLCAKGERDAGASFSTAAPRKATAGLPAFVAASSTLHKSCPLPSPEGRPVLARPAP